MKIISTPEALDEEGKQNLRRMRANLDCHICPYCGESRNTFDRSCQEATNKDGKLHGISCGIVSSTLVPGRFFSRNELEEYPRLRVYVPGHWIHKDLWTCHECGTKWESDPW